MDKKRHKRRQVHSIRVRLSIRRDEYQLHSLFRHLVHLGGEGERALAIKRILTRGAPLEKHEGDGLPDEQMPIYIGIRLTVSDREPAFDSLLQKLAGTNDSRMHGQIIKFMLSEIYSGMAVKLSDSSRAAEIDKPKSEVTKQPAPAPSALPQLTQPTQKITEPSSPIQIEGETKTQSRAPQDSEIDRPPAPANPELRAKMKRAMQFFD